jgi:hypothetical protein
LIAAQDVRVGFVDRLFQLGDCCHLVRQPLPVVPEKVQESYAVSRHNSSSLGLSGYDEVEW